MQISFSFFLFRSDRDSFSVASFDDDDDDALAGRREEDKSSEEAHDALDLCFSAAPETEAPELAPELAPSFL